MGQYCVEKIRNIQSNLDNLEFTLPIDTHVLVSHTAFVFVYMQEFGYYILFGSSQNEEKSL